MSVLFFLFFCVRISCMLTRAPTPLLQFWRQGKGDYFQGIMFLAELSTPSVCLGKILIQVSLSVGPTHCARRMPPGSHLKSCTLHLSLPFFRPMGETCPFVSIHSQHAACSRPPAALHPAGSRHKPHSSVKEFEVCRSRTAPAHAAPPAVFVLGL